jgi:tetratricopeptide (TPR) repeat protein
VKPILWFSIFYFFLFATVVSAQDVVEVETDLGVDQLKPSAVTEKKSIKPRASYNEVKSVPKKSVQPTNNSKADVGGEVADSRVTAAADVAEVESELSEKNAVAEEAKPAVIKTVDNPLTDTQVIEISGSLRKLIEENEQLKKELDDLNDQLKIVKGQQKLESNRMTEIAVERDALKKQNENIVALGTQAEQSRAKLQQQLDEKESEYNLRIVQLQTELAKVLQTKSTEEPVSTEESTTAMDPETQAPGSVASSRGSKSISVDVVSSHAEPAKMGEDALKRGERMLLALDTVNQEKAQLTRDEAKVHYNMGNTYFNQGNYQKAFDEYNRSVELSPEDANAHYNLAFVSGDFLNDPVLALHHYKQYLFLNPGAEDAQMVRQKIIESEIAIKADVHFKSKINTEVKQKKNEFNEVSQF